MSPLWDDYMVEGIITVSPPDTGLTLSVTPSHSLLHSTLRHHSHSIREETRPRCLFAACLDLSDAQLLLPQLQREVLRPSNGWVSLLPWAGDSMDLVRQMKPVGTQIQASG